MDRLVINDRSTWPAWPLSVAYIPDPANSYDDPVAMAFDVEDLDGFDEDFNDVVVTDALGRPTKLIVGEPGDLWIAQLTANSYTYEVLVDAEERHFLAERTHMGLTRALEIELRQTGSRDSDAIPGCFDKPTELEIKRSTAVTLPTLDFHVRWCGSRRNMNRQHQGRRKG